MSHVDEGALHAYLDGALDEYPSAEAARIRAHLDSCAACAERLEEERAVRSDAHAMLGLAAPVVDLPSLEELRAYVQRTAQQRRGISRLQRLGWAASVVLALGAGWMLRGGQLQYGASDFGGVPSADVVSADAASPSEEATGADALEPILARAPERPARSVGRTGNSGSGTASDEPGVEPPTLRASVPASAEVVASADALNAPVSSTDELQKMSSDVAVTAMLAADRVTSDTATRQEQPAPAEVAPGLPVEPMTMEERMAVATTGDSGAAASADATIDAVARADEDIRARRAREADVSRPAAVSALEVEGARTVRVAERELSSRSLVIERQDADDGAVAEPLLAVPGHEVVDVTNLGEGSTPWGVRVRQRMEGGESFEVFHLEPGIDPSILPPLETGVGEASTETAFGWVLVRGALDDEGLAELLLQLFPETP